MATDSFNLTPRDLRYSPNRPEGMPSSDDAYNAQDILAAQEALEREARDTLPHTFDTCTFHQGFLKQPVFACLTCLNWGGVCAACSIACHGSHQLVELFARRNFRCDCGTEKLGAGSKCSLSGLDDAPPNHDNKYDKNFKGIFCNCGKTYDPLTETDMMYQCQVCEDWLHHACLLGASHEDSTTPLDSDSFDMLICGECVTNNAGLRTILDRWAGVKGSGVMVVDKNNSVLGRAITEEVKEEVKEDVKEEVKGENAVAQFETEASGTEKRKAEEEDEGTSGTLEEPPAKKVKQEEVNSIVKDENSASSILPHPISDAASTSGSSTSVSTLASSFIPDPNPKGCKAPPVPQSGESVLSRLEREGARCNVYLEEDWMERWCRCEKCLPTFSKFPYLLNEEEAYEPPEDTDHRSTMELGMEALNRMPRAQAIEGALAFSGLAERLKAYLKPYSDAKITVTKAMVDEFFQSEKELRRAR